MTGDERFPKPDVPWFHQLHPETTWHQEPFDDNTLTSTDGTWVITGQRFSRDAATCTERTDLMPDVWPQAWAPPDGESFYCPLPLGHDGPHMPSRQADLRVTSLRRRVAQPAEVAS